MIGKVLPLSLLYCSGALVLGLLEATAVQAQCIQADVSVQYNISGSKEPTRRSNDVTMVSDRNCSGNVSVTKGVQGNIGSSGPLEQRRVVEHRQQGGKGNPSGVNPPTVQIKTNATADVYNAADKYLKP